MRTIPLFVQSIKLVAMYKIVQNVTWIYAAWICHCLRGQMDTLIWWEERKMEIEVLYMIDLASLTIDWLKAYSVQNSVMAGRSGTTWSRNVQHYPIKTRCCRNTSPEISIFLLSLMNSQERIPCFQTMILTFRNDCRFVYLSWPDII